MNKYLYIILIVFLCGCSSKMPFSLPENLEPEPFKTSDFTIKNRHIKDFITADDDLHKMPDRLIDVELNEPVTLNNLFQILILQGVNVLGTFDSQELISIPNFKGSLKVFLKDIQQAYGLFFKYSNNTLTVRKLTTVYVKVFMPNISDKIKDLLLTFGVQNSFYDEMSGRIVFESDFYTYKKVKDYFYNNPYLTLIIFDVMILEKEESNIYRNGVDWSALSLTLQNLTDTLSSLKLSGNENGLSIDLNSKKLSLSSVYNNLLRKENFNILQSARISTLNGYSCSIDVSEKIPYVSKIDVSSINENSEQVVQGFEFEFVTSGLILNLKPVVVDNLVSILFDAKIQSLVKFLEVGSDVQKVQQPVLSTRSIKNQMIITPGKISLIGGLRYTKGGRINKRLTWLKAGLKNNESRVFSISVLLRCELIRYIFLEEKEIIK